jgi:hypothetical protein
MEQRNKIPSREWLAIGFPPACAAILLVAAFANAAGRHYGWIVVLSCFAAGAMLPLSYTLVLLRERTLYLADPAAIERNRERVGLSRAVWILGGSFLAAGVVLGGISNVVFMATLGGLAFGFWPGLLANFFRLRREHYWDVS